MDTRILAFTLSMILIFGGMIWAIAKFALTGKTKADLTQRMNVKRFENVMGNYHKEVASKQFEMPSEREIGKKKVSV